MSYSKGNYGQPGPVKKSLGRLSADNNVQVPNNHRRFSVDDDDECFREQPDEPHFSFEYDFGCPLCPEYFESLKELLGHLEYHQETDVSPEEEEPASEPPNDDNEGGSQNLIPVDKEEVGSQNQNPVNKEEGQALLSCVHCNKNFLNNLSLTKHRRKEHEPGPTYKCELCSSSFSTYLDRRRHRKSHTRSSLQCPDCKIHFLKQRDLLAHKKRCTSKSLLPEVRMVPALAPECRATPSEAPLSSSESGSRRAESAKKRSTVEPLISNPKVVTPKRVKCHKISPTSSSLQSPLKVCDKSQTRSSLQCPDCNIHFLTERDLFAHKERCTSKSLLPEVRIVPTRDPECRATPSKAPSSLSKRGRSRTETATKRSAVVPLISNKKVVTPKRVKCNKISPTSSSLPSPLNVHDKSQTRSSLQCQDCNIHFLTQRDLLAHKERCTSKSLLPHVRIVPTRDPESRAPPSKAPSSLSESGSSRTESPKKRPTPVVSLSSKKVVTHKRVNCNKKSPTSSSLQSPLKVNDKPQTRSSLQCPDCNNHFLTDRDLLAHKERCALKYLTPEVRIVPTLDYEGYTTPSSSTSESGRSQKTQRRSSRRSPNKKDSTSAVVPVISSPKPVVTHDCVKCSKTYPSAYGLQRHLKSHTKPPPKPKRVSLQIQRTYSCNLCTQSFLKWGDFSEHVKSHEESRGYSMTIPSFYRGKPPTKRYTCRACPKAFYMQELVFDHYLSTHAWRRLIKCPKCDRSFCTTDSLKRHSKRAHRSLLEPEGEEDPLKDDPNDKEWQEEGDEDDDDDEIEESDEEEEEEEEGEGEDEDYALR